MKVHLIRTKKYPAKELQNVLDTLLPFSGPMEFLISEKPILFEEVDFVWADLFGKMRTYRKEQSIPDEDFLVCVTELRNVLNWFSSFERAGNNNIFIHGKEWQYFVYAEERFPIAYQVVLNVLQRILLPNTNKLTSHPLIHERPIGCINDLCPYKPDINFKMRTADICNDCLQAFEENIENPKVIQQTIDIFEGLRKGMVNSRVYLQPLSFEENLPFTVAITKRKMGMTSQPFRKFLMMIDHFDCLIRTAVILLAHLYFSDKKDLTAFFEENRLSEKPSLGAWVAALNKLSSVQIETKTFSLPNDFNRKLSGIIRLEQEQKIVLVRNEKRGHGYIECSDSGYESQFLAQIQVLDEIEKNLSPLFYRFHYYHVISADHIGSGKFEINYIDLSGSNPAFLEDKIKVSFKDFSEVPGKNQCFLVSPKKDKWISLDPYLKFGTCPECNHMRLLIQDGDVYLDPLVGHRVDLT